MSGVYQRNRTVSEYKFFTQAIAIRVEVNKLMASSSVVPKAYRLLNAVPTVETARSIVYNVNRADCFYPNSSFNALERKRYLTLAIADCEQLMLDMQCLMDIGLPVNANRFEALAGMVEEEIKLLKGARKNVRVTGKKTTDERIAEAKAERVKACTLETVADLNSLCKASKQAARGVMWKASTQRYMKDYLRNAAKSRRDLLEGRDICRGFIRFDLWERGKLRHISAVHFPERVVQKSLSQNALVPAIVPTLVTANSANIKGRGTDYALKLLKRHLADHWRRYGRDGYILLGDFSDYFARIAHEPVKRQVADALLDQRVVALEHRLIDAQGEVGLGLGSEPNQICAVAHPNRIDHYVTEMLRPEAYGRYMDDFYLIHESKEYLQVCLLLIERECAKIGIELNPRKTRVVRLTRGFTWLKKRIFYTETGRIVMKPCRDSITRERRKLKKMARMVAEGVMTPEQVEQSYQSWRGGMAHLDAHRSVLAMDALYRSLFENLAGGGCSMRPNPKGDSNGTPSP